MVRDRDIGQDARVHDRYQAHVHVEDVAVVLVGERVEDQLVHAVHVVLDRRPYVGAEGGALGRHQGARQFATAGVGEHERVQHQVALRVLVDRVQVDRPGGIVSHGAERDRVRADRLPPARGLVIELADHVLEDRLRERVRAAGALLEHLLRDVVEALAVDCRGTLAALGLCDYRHGQAPTVMPSCVLKALYSVMARLSSANSSSLISRRPTT